MTVVVEIALALRTQVSELDVIQSAGTLYFAAPGLELQRRSGTLFSARADSYSLRAAVEEGHVVIERNGIRATAEVPASRRVKTYLVWSPTEISAYCGAPGETELLSDRQLFEPPVFPPTSLVSWARRNALIPTTTYANADEGIGAIGTALRGLEDKIHAQGMRRAFWDTTREGRRIVAWTPKHESDIHPTLAGLLADVALVRNLALERERPSGAGLLDFALIAPLTGGGFARASTEFKAAHSADLLHGLTSQLPDSMRSEGADFGFYGILWFKGRHFDRPPGATDAKALQVDVDQVRLEAGLTNVRVLMLDLSLPTPPSAG